MLRILKKVFQKKTTSCAAVIVAAGTSSRMKGTDKILFSLGAEPLIAHTIRVFQESAVIKEIIVVTRHELISEIEEICSDCDFNKVIDVVAGGDSRVKSVMNGLDRVSKNIPFVAIHDGARPFVTDEIISTTVSCAMKYHAAAPAVPVKDTIKIAHDHIVTHTPNRSSLFAVQTPQIFDFDLLRGALSKALEDGTPITDDCSAVEAIGMSVYLTEGSDKNIKVTTPTDLILAQAIWEERQIT